MVFVNQVGGNDQILFDGASTVFNAQGEIKARGSDFNEDMVIYEHMISIRRLDLVEKRIITLVRTN